MECKYCAGTCRKKGWYKKVQKYQCRSCFKYQRFTYRYTKISAKNYDFLVTLHNEGMGYRSISRVLNIPVSSLQRAIYRRSENYSSVTEDGFHQEYEVDELRTFVGSNKKGNYRYIAYAINRQTRRVIDFVIGRSGEVLSGLINKLLSFSPLKIYTDGYQVYRSLIPQHLHYRFAYCINRIERKNLTIRMHLKRLSRETICFSRSEDMLERSLRLYFFSNK